MCNKEERKGNARSLSVNWESAHPRGREVPPASSTLNITMRAMCAIAQRLANVSGEARLFRRREQHATFDVTDRRRTRVGFRRDDSIIVSTRHRVGCSAAERRGTTRCRAMPPDEQGNAGNARVGVGGGAASQQKQGWAPPNANANAAQARNAAQKVPVAQQALTKFLELPTVPIGSYVSSPTSPLHWLDPRVKQAWLAALLVFPPNGTPEEKVCVCAALALATATALPSRVWRPQLTTLTGVCALLFALMAIGADSVVPVIQPREPFAGDEGLLSMPGLDHAYRYVLVHLGPVQVTRRGANLAISSSCVTFTALQSAHLTLCTTTPEAMVAALRWYLRPLAAFRAPVDEITFTLLLSLRFTAIVFEEVRNISLGLAARGVDWRALGWRGTIGTFSALLARTLESLFATSSAVADAVSSRGYQGADRHRFFTPPPPGRGRGGTALARVGDVAATTSLIFFVAHFNDVDVVATARGLLPG